MMSQGVAYSSFERNHTRVTVLLQVLCSTVCVLMETYLREDPQGDAVVWSYLPLSPGQPKD